MSKTLKLISWNVKGICALITKVLEGPLLDAKIHVDIVASDDCPVEFILRAL
jgi:exonuclease III